MSMRLLGATDEPGGKEVEEDDDEDEEHKGGTIEFAASGLGRWKDTLEGGGFAGALCVEGMD